MSPAPTQGLCPHMPLMNQAISATSRGFENLLLAADKKYCLVTSLPN